MKIDAIESRNDKKCYICKKKKHLKKNCTKKNREKICALNEINWEDLSDDKQEDDWFKIYETQDSNLSKQNAREEKSEMKFAEFEPKFS